MKITAAVVPVRQLRSRSKRSTARRPPRKCLCGSSPGAVYHTDLHAFTRAFAGMTTPKLCPEIGGQALSRCQLAGTACQPLLHWVTYG